LFALRKLPYNLGMSITQLKTIVGNSEFKDEDNCPWQSIMNVGYNHWQESEGLKYHAFADFLNNNFGPLAKMSLLLGKWNQQVENGGVVQYFGNGYASRESAGGCFVEHTDIDLHSELIELVESHLDVPCKAKLLTILKLFCIEEETLPCDSCDGNGEVEIEYDDIAVTEMCQECSGTGESNNFTFVIPEAGHIVKLYYAMNEKMVEKVTAFYDKILS